jgi:hypothetical protein
VVQHNLPFVITFSDYFALPAPERAARRLAVFLVLAAQMLYASVAHISND